MTKSHKLYIFIKNPKNGKISRPPADLIMPIWGHYTGIESDGDLANVIPGAYHSAGLPRVGPT